MGELSILCDLSFENGWNYNYLGWGTHFHFKVHCYFTSSAAVEVAEIGIIQVHSSQSEGLTYLEYSTSLVSAWKLSYGLRFSRKATASGS